ncbi:alpha,alpha-trehalose-phosphate synthase (UDP-forming) [Natronorubrum bangense]|uniref:Alpha,alpha-trehalose-phosphate synthase (UDP-forming) n=2 Tax=Natronorubrum bangense TaxID=61858 RepID=L9W7K4_9EURY|nr:trehalose-6-phosphate synthase [Natronorubrum bangense]ELY45317.1 Alpha,alpha-trehalose-phosphate synthase (UDP- forming) [Natronorubrum bangense JCM 10635]QCC56834.1 trehalose-6-phosphate synthase [Natronorubrum bangense]
MRVTDERLSLTAPSNRQIRADGNGQRTDDSQSNGVTGLDSLIVVSNRQPYRHEYEAVPAAADGDRATPPSDVSTRTDGAVTEPTNARITVDEPTGGLTAGLDPVLQQASGTWIAWGDGDADFDVADEHNCVAVPPDDPSYTLQRIDLSEEAVDSYYYGFSNCVLWPLCHGFVDLVNDRSNDFEWYRTINERFAEAVSEHATADSVVWLQDYHFALASRMIRDRVPRSTTVAQFWHVPWPTLATFQHCPVGDQILEGLLGNDLLGFHVDRYAERFLECVQRSLPAAAVDWERRTVKYDGESTRVVATPMGVDAESYDQDARSVSSSQLSSLFDRYDVSRENLIGLGVDRLDYTKGIPERLAAIERFLEWNPSWHDEFTFIQTATPSRTDIQTYEQHGALVRSEVERINQRFGTQAWDPIVYTEDYISAADLCALYRRAELMIVSPLADGMNLVAQEYVAASVDSDGTLVLSQDAGAHETLGSHALTVDPTDVSGFAHQIERAVSLSPSERHRRMHTLRNRVFDRDLEWWMETQFDWIRYLRHRTSRDAATRDSDPDGDSYERTPSM